MVQSAAVPLQGYVTGFMINGAIMIVSGVLGLLLLWPNTQRARFTEEAAQPDLLRA